MPSWPRRGTRTGGTDGESCDDETADTLLPDGGQGPNDRRQGDQPNQPPGTNQPQGGGQGQPPQGGGQGRQPQGGQGQPSQGGQGRQPQGQQPRGQQQGYNQGGPGNQPRGPPQQGNDGFSRRQLLAGGGGAVAILGGGWFFFLRDDGATDSPEAVVEAFYSALDDGDIERANSLIHAESPQGELTESNFNQNASFTVESVEVPDEDSGYTASEYDSVQEFRPVRIELTVSANGDESTRTVNGTVAKNADGEWKIWE